MRNIIAGLILLCAPAVISAQDAPTTCSPEFITEYLCAPDNYLRMKEALEEGTETYTGADLALLYLGYLSENGYLATGLLPPAPELYGELSQGEKFASILEFMSMDEELLTGGMGVDLIHFFYDPLGEYGSPYDLLVKVMDGQDEPDEEFAQNMEELMHAVFTYMFNRVFSVFGEQYELALPVDEEEPVMMEFNSVNENPRNL